MRNGSNPLSSTNIMKKERIEYDYFCDACGLEKNQVVGYVRETVSFGIGNNQDAYIPSPIKDTDEHVCQGCLNKFLFLVFNLKPNEQNRLNFKVINK